MPKGRRPERIWDKASFITASSGIYAIVCHLELSRIGYNDIKQEYAITPEERQLRASLLLQSLLHTFY